MALSRWFLVTRQGEGLAARTATLSGLTLAASIACYLLLGGASLVAQDQRSVHVGVGANSCGVWLASREGQRSSVTDVRNENGLRVGMMLSWEQGFIYGLMVSLPADIRVQGTLLIPDSDAMTAWLDKYCKQEPLKLFMDAGVALYGELRKKEIQK